MKAKMMNIAIPMEVLEDSGLDLSAVLELEAGEGALVIRNATGGESFVCDGDCEGCPFVADDCDGNCADCPCQSACDRVNEKGIDE